MSYQFQFNHKPVLLHYTLLILIRLLALQFDCRLIPKYYPNHKQSQNYSSTKYTNVDYSQYLMLVPFLQTPNPDIPLFKQIFYLMKLQLLIWKILKAFLFTKVVWSELQLWNYSTVNLWLNYLWTLNDLLLQMMAWACTNQDQFKQLELHSTLEIC